jgi:hypothetical protein
VHDAQCGQMSAGPERIPATSSSLSGLWGHPTIIVYPRTEHDRCTCYCTNCPIACQYQYARASGLKAPRALPHSLPP